MNARLQGVQLSRRQATPTVNALGARLIELARKAAALYDRAARGEAMTARDLALAVEYSQQYVDILDQMQDAPVVHSKSGRVKFE
jgi:hypothetical protein